jgi:hypothetical protein
MLTDLWIGEAVVATAALKAGIARRLSSCRATEVCLKGAVKPQQHVLQDLGVDLGIVRACCLQVWQLSAFCW